uniref:Uncharacterized protein n=1 Tax=Anguilla anguilla TaxID=7936 RepID=A0A0E9T9L0_ANGAN
MMEVVLWVVHRYLSLELAYFSLYYSQVHRNIYSNPTKCLQTQWMVLYLAAG